MIMIMIMIMNNMIFILIIVIIVIMIIITIANMIAQVESRKGLNTKQHWRIHGGHGEPPPTHSGWGRSWDLRKPVEKFGGGM